jgi:hypothetical protein
MRLVNSTNRPQSQHHLPIGQAWEVGEVVKVGFLKLRVIGKASGAYRLCGLGEHAARLYRFTPHQGLERELAS